MHFYRNQWERDFAEELRGKISVFLTRAQELDESGAFPFQNIEDLKGNGYTKMTLPEQYGGMGKGLYEFLLMQELIAEYSGPTALAIGWHAGITLQLQDSRRGWNQQVLEETLQKIGDGALINRAASEAATGSPTRGGRPGTNAVKETGQWVINGRKTFTTLAPVLDLFLVSAWIEEKNQLGWFLIEKDASGLSIDKTWDVISMQSTGSEDLVLENVRIEEKYLVELADKKEFDEAWPLHIPACYIGIAKAARDYALQFASSYSPNSIKGTISDLPNVKQKIGEIELELMRSRHFLYSVASQWVQHPERHKELKPQLGAVKKAVTNSAIHIVDQAMRIVGAKSLQRTNPMQRYYRDVRAGLHNPPMDDMVVLGLAEQAIAGIKKTIE